MAEHQTISQSSKLPSMPQAMWYWLKLGFISFGGPAGQIAIMHHDLVEKKRWISEKRFLHALNYCMVLPGPEAQQLATYIGWLMHRTWGGLIAGGLFVLPSLLILMLLTWIYLVYGHLSYIAGILYGIKPAVIAIVMFAAYRMGSRVLHNAVLWSFSLAAFVAVAGFDVPFPYVVLTAALAGYAGSLLAPQKFIVQSAHVQTSADSVDAAISDSVVLPHTRFSSKHMLKVIAAGAVLWALPIALLMYCLGRDAVLTQMAWFFTKAALLTFGGAYAVLPYVYQGTVEAHAWLSPAQMMDGLALGETTPGPLIMIVAFVGFVGGWTHAIFGSDSLVLAGMAAACVVTYFTFLPSFLFIFIGSPLVESTQGRLGFTAPLTGITAAVVGVILNLAVFFTYHIVWPSGWEGGPDWFAALAAIAATIALVHFRVGIIPLIAASGLMGFLRHMLT